jgi:hypothetical protein
VAFETAGIKDRTQLLFKGIRRIGRRGESQGDSEGKPEKEKCGKESGLHNLQPSTRHRASH